MRISPHPVNVHVHRIGLTGEVDGIALVTHQIHLPRLFLTLEYDFFRHVVHAGLAKVVHGSAVLARFYMRENENTLRKLLKFVLLPLRFSLFKLSNLCVELSFAVLQRIDLITCRRHLLLQLERGILDLENPFVESLRCLGDFDVTCCADDGFHQIEGRAKGGEGSCDRSEFHEGSPDVGKVGVGTTDSTLGANPHPNHEVP
jgi:hypothetical protein